MVFKPKKKIVMKKKVYRRKPKAKVNQDAKILAVVKRVLARRVEKKIASTANYQRTSITPYSSTTELFPFDDLTSVFQNVAQGVGQGDRIGNKIMVKNLVIKGHFYRQPILDYSGNVLASVPAYVRMILFRNKQNLDTPTDLSNFIQDGNTAVAPDNTLQDLTRYYNKDDYIIYATKTIKIGHAGLFPNGSTPIPNEQIPTNNDFPSAKFFSFNLMKHINKSIKYSDVAPLPTNFGMFLGFMVYAADGSTIGPLSAPVDFPIVGYKYTVNMTYTDE